MTGLSCDVYTGRMPFADMKLNVRKPCLQLSCQFSINKLTFTENYADLRQLFDTLSKYTTERLTIKKK